MVLLLPFLPFSNPFYTNNQTDFFLNQIISKFCWKPFISPRDIQLKPKPLFTGSMTRPLTSFSPLSLDSLDSFLFPGPAKPYFFPKPHAHCFLHFLDRVENAYSFLRWTVPLPIEVSESNSTWLAGWDGMLLRYKGAKRLLGTIYTLLQHKKMAVPLQVPFKCSLLFAH